MLKPYLHKQAWVLPRPEACLQRTEGIYGHSKSWGTVGMRATMQARGRRGWAGAMPGW